MSKRAQTSVVTTSRRTEASDAKEIVKYVNNYTLDLFGPACKEIGKIHEFM
jgi:hypothetical protein